MTIFSAASQLASQNAGTDEAIDVTFVRIVVAPFAVRIVGNHSHE